MRGKIKQLLKKIKKRHKYNSCYNDCEKVGLAVFGMCHGCTDKGCPYYTKTD